MRKNYAIIVAAGRGKRMGTSVNKQFLNINKKPILYYSLNTFSKCDLIDGIIIVCAENEIEYCREEIVEKYKIDKVINIVAGGEERQHSVYNGLKAIEKCEIVLVHDGARPFITPQIIEDGIMYANIHGACACGVMPKDTIKVKDQMGFSSSAPDRNSLFVVQTPQCFKYDLIFQCHEKLSLTNTKVTDDTMVVEYYGNKVYLYDGSYNNIKITTLDDLYISEKIAEKF